EAGGGLGPHGHVVGGGRGLGGIGPPVVVLEAHATDQVEREHHGLSGRHHHELGVRVQPELPVGLHRQLLVAPLGGEHGQGRVDRQVHPVGAGRHGGGGGGGC